MLIVNEFIIVLEFPLYNDLRKKYVNKYFWKNKNMQTCVELLTTENYTVIK